MIFPTKEHECRLQGTVDMVIGCVMNFVRWEGEYRIVPKIDIPKNARWDRTISASLDVFVLRGRGKTPLCTIRLLLLPPGDRTHLSVQKPEPDSPLWHFLELLKGEFKRLGFEWG